MKERQIRDGFSQIKVSAEMDERMRERIKAQARGAESSDEQVCRAERPRKRIRSELFWKKASVIAAVGIIGIAGISQIPQVQTFAETIAGKFVTIFDLGDEKIEVESDYVKISQEMSDEWNKYGSLTKAEETLGIKLLKYDKSSEENHSWSFYPDTTTEGEIYGVTVTNYSYILGDLKRVQTKKNADPAIGNTISYEAGEKFRSPISCQMIIRAEAESATEDLYPGYETNNIDWIAEFDAEKYYCENLNTEVILYEIETDGPAEWDLVEPAKTAVMQFIYEGVEYHFMGQVSLDTMKELAEHLHN